MFFANRPARPLRAAAFLALAGLTGLAGLSGPAFAQPKGKAAPAPAAPAPAAPAAAPTGAAQTGPQIVNVKSDPAQTEWTKVCGKDQGSNTDVCYTTRDFVSDQGQPVLAVAVYEMKNPTQKQEVRVVRYLLPLGLLLQPGIRFSIDGQQATPGKFAVCFPNGCFAEAGNVGPELINAMKKGTTLSVSVQNQTQREVTFAVPIAGFGKAFDGPAIDPKVLEEQQKKLQAELEKRSEDMRKKLEQQNAGGAAAPAATPPKP
ncbi:invasion associated locus B family protein [Methylobacterium sp. J-068]|uniref:invasion associated locus B family protein n=1 Tax=Methylobacterium sp. J-068 TaxID=2836649 RepID=UPI001FBAC3FC|nr:invasion associated locus B family protein [Methylobacterium sp. J-068]MCJ2035720.1 invasion associated locus B family protein [Methylobacterium sp. J-068]